MGIQKQIILLCALLVSTLSHAAPQCLDLFHLSPQTSQKSIFHNKEVEGIVAQGLNLSSLQSLLQRFLEKGTFDIVVDKSGYVVAAEVGGHAGGYGEWVWARDFGQIVRGLTHLPEVIEFVMGSNANALKDIFTPRLSRAREDAKISAQAAFRFIASPLWSTIALENIRDTNKHLHPEGYKNVIWIRRLFKPLQENRDPTSEELTLEGQWGHKQNDGLAALARAIMNGIELGEISLADMPASSRQNFILLAAYFVRLQYWQMWDVGAWEEGMGTHTSSIGVVANFLKYFNSHFYASGNEGASPRETLFFKDLKENVYKDLLQNQDPQMVEILEKSLSPESLVDAVEQGTRFVRDHIGAEVPIETRTDQVSRFLDSALFHILWERRNILSIEQQRQMVIKLKDLEKPAGYIRYYDDWFLYGGAEAARHIEALGLQNKLAIPDGQGHYKIASPEDVSKIIELHKAETWTKNMKPIVELAGAGLEAQWTLGDSYLTEFYADLYLKEKKPEDLEQALYHYKRSLSQITGTDEVTTEGNPVAAYRLPEARSPIYYFEDGVLKSRDLVSPNSPLNWSTAQFISATRLIIMALKEQQKSLH